MPGPLDDTLKHLTELSPRDWVVRGGWSAAPATVIDADIATITGATDKVIRVQGPPDWLLAVDFQSGHDAVAKLSDLLLYNPGQAAELWSATYILMGLRYEQALIQPLLQGVLAMKESVTYQAILQEGRAEGKSEEARRMLLLFGRDTLGEPSAAAQAALDTVTDVNHLEELAQHIHRATSWDELRGLASPEPRSPRRKRRS